MKKRSVFPSGLSIQQKQKTVGVVFVLPSFLALLCLVIYPMLNGFYVSFFNTNLVSRSTFVGLRYYRELLAKPEFYDTLLTTLKFTFCVVTGHFLVGRK